MESKCGFRPLVGGAGWGGPLGTCGLLSKPLCGPAHRSIMDDRGVGHSPILNRLRNEAGSQATTRRALSLNERMEKMRESFGLRSREGGARAVSPEQARPSLP